MKKKWNLSDKISWTDYNNCRIFIGHKFLLIKDVKKFIKRVKKMMEKMYDEEPTYFDFFKEIDKLAGEDLI